MKKVLIFFLLSSILLGQSFTPHKQTFTNNIPNNHDIRNMVHSVFLNQMDDPETGRPTKEVEQIWNYDQWENNMMTEWEYAPGKINANYPPGLMYMRYYYWYLGWNDSGNDEFVYDGQGNIIEHIMNYSGSPTGRWVYTGPFFGGYATTSVYQYYDSGYINSQMVTYIFDANGCIIEEIWYMWNGSTWIPFLRIQKYYGQPCCPDRWVFASWTGTAWEIYYMASFIYALANCMTDMVPYFNFYTYWYYQYRCNPTQVLMGETTDGVNMSQIDSSEEFTYDVYCKILSYLLYLYSQGQLSYMYTVFGYGQPMLKPANPYDNSNQRLTSQTTQIRQGNDLVNNNRTWYSYEGLELDVESEKGIPGKFSLKQNYPNPFNPLTTITFDLSEDTNVEISVYNTAGRLVRVIVDKKVMAGSKTIYWDGRDSAGNLVAGGVYFYNLKTDDYIQTRKMVLLR